MLNRTIASIKNIHARESLDSRGFPTIEVEEILATGSFGIAQVPSGASTGSYEAHELRDKNKEYLNKSVFDAVNNINSKISKSLINKNSSDQKAIDKILINLDKIATIQQQKKFFLDIKQREKIRTAYLKRHAKNKKSIHSPSSMSDIILWSAPTLQQGIKNFEKRYKVDIIYHNYIYNGE